MSDPHDPLSWVEKAEEDLIVARMCAERQPILVDAATFHAQQCAEKYLKAILVRLGRTPPKIHDLAVLANLCSNIGVTLPHLMDDLVILTEYVVQARYPGEAITDEEARRALDIAKRVRSMARQALELG